MKKQLQILITLCSVAIFLLPGMTIFGGAFNTEEYEENDISNFSIFAINDVWILNNCTINSGDVGVSSPNISDQLESTEEIDSGKEVFIGYDAYLEQDTSIIGKSVTIKRGASVYNVYHNDLINEGEIRGEEGDFYEMAPDITLPEFPEPQPGTENITVYYGENVILEPGNYGDVTVKTYGTLTLSGGTYHMENLELGYYKANIVFQKPTEIIINNRLTTFIKSYIGPDEECDVSAKDLFIYVKGTNNEESYFGMFFMFGMRSFNRFFGGFPKAVQFGGYNNIHANIYAPNGTVWIQRDTVAKGAFIGKDVLLGYGVDITLDSAESQASITHFVDPNLEAAVRDALDKPEGDIYTWELELLTSLNASGREIVDLTGIEDCTNLLSLVLSYNSITDITPLSELVNLISVNLNANSITDITALTNLTNLSRLYIGDNDITDINPIEGLLNLSHLVLEYNGISDIKALTDLTNLTRLVLNDNYITDITPLEKLTNLVFLSLYNNDIEDISSITGMTNLTILDLYDNRIANLWPLANLTNLTRLVLDYNEIEDITPLSGLENLTVLYLNDNYISDISALTGMINLSTLVLDNNGISSIAPLQGMANLSELYLGYNTISDITSLENLEYLSVLYLNNNSIADITALDGLLNLSALYLHDNSISDIKALVRNCDEGGLGEFDFVSLYNNNFSQGDGIIDDAIQEDGIIDDTIQADSIVDDTIMDDIQHLIDAGVEVMW